MPVVIFVSNKLNILDGPSREGLSRMKIHAAPVSRLGGIAMLISFAIAVLVWGDWGQLRFIYLASFAFFAVGFLDDIRPIPAKVRLCLQVGFSCCVVLIAGLRLETLLVFGYQLTLDPFVSTLLSVFILVGSINSINMIDGADGLAGGITLIGTIMLSYLHFFTTRDPFVLSLLTLGIMGSILGFLRYNTHPASVFMGDGGSYWLGFLVGTIFIITLGGGVLGSNGQIVFNSPAKVPFISALLCIGIPVIDTFAVIVDRLLKGKSPFKSGRNHFHDTLIAFGLDQRRSVITIYFIALLLSAIGTSPILFPKYHLDALPYLTALAVFLFFLFGKRSTHSEAFRLTTSQSIQKVATSNFFRRSMRGWAAINRYFVYFFLVITPLLAGQVPKELGVIAAVMAGVIFLSIFFPASRDDFMHSALVALTAIVILLAVNYNVMAVQLEGKRFPLQLYYNRLYVGFSISLALYLVPLLFKRYFIATPTDFLLVFISLLILIIPEPWQSEYRLSVISARSLVLFIALRTFVFSHSSVIRRCKLATLVSLCYVALNGLLQFRILY